MKTAFRRPEGSVNGVRLRTLTFAPHDELEGYRPLREVGGVFFTSSRKTNLVVGAVREVKPRASPPPP